MQYYTLEEAAQLLDLSPDELKKMAERNEVRPFRDRGSMRFRKQEIDEMARRRGLGSDPDLQLGDAPASPSPKRKSKLEEQGEVFDFTLTTDDDQVEIGQELNLGTGSSSKSGPKSPSGPKSSPGPKSSKSKASGPRSPAPGPKSPPPSAGSDSDVRLVPDGSGLDFQLASDSDVKLVDDANPKSSPKLSGKSSGRRDSSIKMVPLESDSDVKVGDGGKSAKSGSDSDIRLQEQRRSKLGKGKEPLVTEEIDLDAEMRKQQPPQKPKGKGSKFTKHQPPPKLPTSSPFELSESDLDLPLEEEEGLSGPLEDSSSDFDLTPAGDDSSPLELGSDEVPMSASSDDEVTLGELSGGTGESGINLRDPADSGISLEQEGSSEEIDFELSLDAGSTPKPAPSGPQVASDDDSSSEFELTLDDSSGDIPAVEESSSDSEFELSLDADAGMASDSDSEFELTLDDSGVAPAVESESGEGEKDIFETDFEVPALEDDSGSQAVALEDADTDLESSDFELALGDDDAPSDDESQSQVLALEEDSDVDEAAETQAARPRRQRGAPVLAEDEAEELLEEEEMDFDTTAPEEEEEPAPVGAAAAAPPAEWGAMPMAVMLPCVVVMFLVGLMGYELVHGLWGYRQGTPVTSTLIDPLARMFTDDLPKQP